jgi:CHAT domain-containing protein
MCAKPPHSSFVLKLAQFIASGSIILIVGQSLSLPMLSAFASSQAAHSEAIAQTAPAQLLQQLLQQGREFYEAGQYSEAIAVWQRAEKAFQTQGDRPYHALVLSNLSLAYQQLGQWEPAKRAIATSLELIHQSDSRSMTPILAQALNTQGSLQLMLGQAEAAFATWQKATVVYTQAKDKVGITRSLLNQAQALQSLGFYRRVLATLAEVNQSLKTQPNSVTKATGLRLLGNHLRLMSQFDQSQQVLQQSLAIAQQLSSPTDISAALFSLGNTAAAQHKTQAAFTFYQQAATLAPTPIIRLQVQLNQLDLLLETQQWSAAQKLSPTIQAQFEALPPSRTLVFAQIEFAENLMTLAHQQSIASRAQPTPQAIAQILVRAIQQSRSLDDRRAESYAMGMLGRLYEINQQGSDAQRLTQQALLMAQEIDASDIAYRWQWQFGRLLKTQGNKAGAIVAYTEAVNTLQRLRRDLVTINADAQFSFRESVEPVYRQLVDLLLEPDSRDGRTIQTHLVQARNVIESLQIAELNNFFREACLDVKQPIDRVIDEQASTAAAFYPIILPDRLEVIVKLPQQTNLRHYTVRLAKPQVEAILEQLRQNLEKPYTSSRGKVLSQQVYDWLIRPAETDLAQSRVKTLVFVLDGVLRNVPVAALHDGQQYLVAKYAIALAPSLRLVDPKPLVRPQLKALTAGLSEARPGFSPLNYVNLELNRIQSEVPTQVLFNQTFTSKALEQQIHSLPFPVVHLATHGQFSSNANDTFVLAWDKRILVNELSSVLQRRNQTRSKAIELLVLSACQTAAGDDRAVLGLAGIAVRSGARSTIASLWNLNDESGALLMERFYQNLKNPKVPNKAEALRLAQRSLMQDPNYDYAAPAYWAPYVLVGNWL